MRTSQVLLTILIAAIAATFSTWLVAKPKVSQAETTLERVLRTGTLRCAYTIYPTYVEKDPTTGKLSGMFYDMVNTLGKTLGVKVDWVAEVGTDSIFEGFRTNRYDAVCAGYWRTPGRAHGGSFTRPIVFTPVYLYIRNNEQRFHAMEDFNKPTVTFSTMDGEATEAVVKGNFPQAKTVSLPGLTPATDRFLNVAAGKTDATMMEGGIGAEFMAANPGKIRLFTQHPMMTGASVLVIPHGESDLKDFLDAGISGMLESGEMRQLVHRYIKYPGAVLLPADEFKTE